MVVRYYCLFLANEEAYYLPEIAVCEFILGFDALAADYQ